MVGVPGRSKGCNTCRKRRIGCSLERPQCSQCIKSNRFCGGYQRERVFIIGPKIIQTTPNESVETSSPTQTAKTSRIALALAQSQDDVSNQSTAKWHFTTSPLADQASMHAVLREQLVNEFIYGFIPEATLAAQERGLKEQTHWILMLPDLSTRTKALETSIFAIATAKLGRLHGDPTMVRESLELYSKGLWELQRALWDPKLMFKDETLASCLILQLYEVLECPSGDGSGFLTHSRGCARLIQLRGPKAHCSALGHQLFLAARFSTTMEALSQHQATYLSDPEWIELPWKDTPKSPFDRLTDILIHACQIYQRADDVSKMQSPSSAIKSLLQVAGGCWQIDAQLRQLYKELEDAYVGPLFWPEFSKLDNPTDDPELGKLFPVAYSFPSLRIAHSCMIYWTLSMMLWSGLQALYREVATLNNKIDGLEADRSSPACPTGNGSPLSNFDISILPPLEHRADVLPLARNICQSIEYCMQDSMKTMGPLSTSFPLQTVIANLRNDHQPDRARELAWAVAALERVQRSGARIMEFLDTFGKEEAKKGGRGARDGNAGAVQPFPGKGGPQA